MLLSERNSLFESLINKLNDYPELNKLLYNLLFTGTAIPYTVGPGTVGTLLVMGATAADWKMRGIEMAGITAAVLLIGCLLYFCERMEAILKRQGLEILTKLTGLFLAALAAQLILSALHTVIHGS